MILLTARKMTLLKVAIHLAGILPLIWLLFAINYGGLSADPAKDIQHFTGRTALKFLLFTLMIAPVAYYLKQPLLFRIRRLSGLWCFAWATLHMISYAALELGIENLRLFGAELISRPYLTLGLISWLILLLLAATSFRKLQQIMGNNWQRVHNGVYIVAILAPIHYLWSVKTLSPQPWLYTFGALLLVGWRLIKFVRGKTDPLRKR
ncbi:MAG: Protein-methionine-sulfoxide reductase heme-binding subunit MsrQ [Candidatus Erwinia impunctatus]|nr:Protein-methionine-sulfoxide reductase heme-binding subunit MsrQ [Culicoides impunctatus]